MKALADQEGKLERLNRAETNLNQNTSNSRRSEESREEERMSEDIVCNRENKIIKIGAYNINRIKGDNMKVEQLAEYGKLEEYSIIRIIETNIGEQERKF